MSWQDRIQANIVRGLPASQVEYRFLCFRDRDEIRRFVRHVLPDIHDARWQRQRYGAPASGAPGGVRRQMTEPVLNLAFTRTGIELATGANYSADDDRRSRLGTVSVPLPRSTDAFAPRETLPATVEALAEHLLGDRREVRNSMFRRLDLLGEVPKRLVDCTWDRAWIRRPIHALLWASGPAAERSDGRNRNRGANPTLDCVEAATRGYCVLRDLSLTGSTLDDGRDHFGFVDGAGQPAIEGVHSPQEYLGRGARESGGWRGLRPGEFVVGEPDEGGEARRVQPADVLHNATFLVFRQIEMWPERFEAFLRQASEWTGGTPSRTVAGWMMGRHPKEGDNEGTSLMVPGPTEDIDFIYGYDPEGLRCPLGAHVRRANPRDSLGGDGARVNRHRIIRRGMPYVKQSDGGGETKGLAFLAMQARIEDQFEFVQSRWLNTGPTLGVGNDPDPFAGVASADVDRARFVHQGAAPIALRLPTGESRFTAVRGGEYFVMPTLRGLYNMSRP